MVLCVRATPPTEGIPSFVGFMRDVVTPYNYIVVNGANLAITAATQGSLSLLGISTAEVATQSLQITEWIEDFEVC